jgi:uridylate kinase
MPKLAYKRILLKLSGEVLEGKKGSGIDFKVLDSLAGEIAEVKKLGAEIAIVIGGGNFWRYRDFKNSGLDRVHSDYMGMMATIMNSTALADAFKKHKVPAVTVSAFPIPVIAEKYDRDAAAQYLKEGKIVICAGGTGNPFFTTDSAASLRALELQCNVMLKATMVDYVYDKDPKKHKGAKSFKKITYAEVLKRKLEVIDLSAIALCGGSGLPVIVFNLTKKGNIAKVVKGEDIGTIIS